MALTSRMDPHESGRIGARRRWGPARHLAVGDLPAPDRAVLAAVADRARAERQAQGLPETITGPSLAAVAILLAASQKAEPAECQIAAGSAEGHPDDLTAS